MELILFIALVVAIGFFPAIWLIIIILFWILVAYLGFSLIGFILEVLSSRKAPSIKKFPVAFDDSGDDNLLSVEGGDDLDEELLDLDGGDDDDITALGDDEEVGY